jgi:hypothetical protein
MLHSDSGTLIQMPFVYHMVPKDMVGAVLYPLNVLKDKNPEAYEFQVKKYKGREVLMDRRIDRLDCKWNDVLHLSPLDPAVVMGALKQLGKDFPLGYFEIDAESLEPEKTTVYLYTPREKGNFEISQTEFVDYNPKEIGKYAVLPEGTIEYYKESIKGNLPIFMYHLVPHILYKGVIDTTELKKISI